MNNELAGLDSTAAPRTQPPRSTARASDTRENVQRHEDWVAPGRMPSPDPRPGVRYKWVRKSVQGVDDKTNMVRSMTQGWVAVDGSDVPELAYLVNHAAMHTNKEGVVSSTVEYGGLILMRISEHAARQRDAYYRRMHDTQEESIETTLMQNQDARMPLKSQRKSKVVIGGKSSGDY